MTTIAIAAALIHDGGDRLLLVRKRGSCWFMQAGGKIAIGEDARSALRRELHEELGWTVAADEPTDRGRFTALAANEPDTIIDAHVFALMTRSTFAPRAEIEEVRWIASAAAPSLPLAPLTRLHVLPLFETMRSGPSSAHA